MLRHVASACFVLACAGRTGAFSSTLAPVTTGTCTNDNAMSSVVLLQTNSAFRQRSTLSAARSHTKGPRSLSQESRLRQYISQSLDPGRFENSEDNKANRTRLHLSTRAAERLLLEPPRYMFGIHTGHTGSTSLGNQTSYTGPYKENATFMFEAEHGRGHFATFAKDWQKWAATKPSLDEAERKVRDEYKSSIDVMLTPIGQSHTFVDIGHHNLLGLLRAMPKVFGDDAFFVRLRRDRVHTAYSFAQYERDLCNDWFRVCPLTDRHLLSPRSGTWTVNTWRSMTDEQQHLWFIDEVEAEFQQLLKENPDVSYLECNWSDDLGPCFDMVATILGLDVANGGAHMKSHTGRTPLSDGDRDRIIQADKDYRSFMDYTDEVLNSISEAEL